MEEKTENKKLEWERLLCKERCRKSSTIKKNLNSIEDIIYDHRNEFDKDYDRVVYSSSIRRLQDKAQVFPLQENDFIRTRLTHSIEASAFGRSFGYAIGEWLLYKKEFKDYNQVRELSALLQVSTLIHDLGNPPFGHYGESVIQKWFEKWFKTDEFEKINKEFGEKSLSENQKKDFIYFDGNAQTLRIVSKLQLLNDEYGLNFTFGTLSTIIKYPWPSSDKRAKKKKFGFFNSEKDLVDNINKEIGLEIGLRHPATYLLEASDDIAYLGADIEDGVKKGIIPWKDEYNNIKSKLMKENSKVYERMFGVLDQIKENNKNNILSNELIEVQNFKVQSQGLMFRYAVLTFQQNYEKIMRGEFDGDLLKNSETKSLYECLKELASQYCFSNQEVINLELVGDNVINGLLDRFVLPLVKCKSDEELKIKNYEGKIYNLISENFKYVCCYDKCSKKNINFSETDLYSRLLLITDYISGMTDSYAVNLYRRILGISLP